MNSSTAPAVPGTNGETSIADLFALSDEQILEIEPDTHDVEIADFSLDDADRAILVAPASLPAPASESHNRRLEAGATSDQSTDEGSRAANNTTSSPSHQSPLTSHQPSTPPQWLAERMADPQAGPEARELWNGVQQSRQEAAAFREVFAKPEDARAAAQRSRLLDDIDRAYFTGDSSQRAQLAATMLREDPGAFREMVFAGLRALEETGNANAANALGRHSTETVGAGLAPPADARATSGVGAQHAAPQPGNTPANDAHLAHYAAFERTANEDLERTVGTAIERTLDQALPHGNRPENASMRGRLAATVRQEIEKALQGDRQLGEQVAQVLSARRLDNNARAQVVRLIGDRAQQLVPSTAKRVLGEWTQTTLASHRGRTSRIDAATARRDVEVASPAPSSSAATNSIRATQSQNRQGAAAGANLNRKVDYRRLSDEQILNS
jgi:hypothetical protein